MATAPLLPRVTALEQALIDLAQAQAHTEAEIGRLAAENRLFQAEMRDFKAEMRDFKAEMREFKSEMRAANLRSDKRWGELANKMGTLVEDIILPGIEAVFQALFPGRDGIETGQRLRRRHSADAGRMREFDCVASATDAFLVVEVKSGTSAAQVEELLGTLSEVRDFFPEAHAKRVYGALASFNVHPSLVRAAERQGLIVLGLATGLLRVLNAEGFEPRAF